MNFSNLLPLPKLDFKSLDSPRDKDHIYFKFYGLDFDVRHYFGAIDCHSLGDEFEISCHVFHPESSQGSVFFIHGLFDHAGSAVHVVQAALDKNLSVFLFDLPGHGLSSGEQTSIRSFEQYVDVFRQSLKLVAGHMPKPWHVCAQSTGASTLMWYMREEKESLFESYVAFSPLVKPYRWTFFQIPYFLLRNFVPVRKRTFSENSQDQNFLNFVKNKDPLQSRVLRTQWLNAMHENLKAFNQGGSCQTSLTVFQGTNDTTVDWKYNLKAIKSIFSNVHIKLLENAGHHLVNEIESVRQEWILPLQKIWLKGNTNK